MPSLQVLSFFLYSHPRELVSASRELREMAAAGRAAQLRALEIRWRRDGVYTTLSRSGASDSTRVWSLTALAPPRKLEGVGGGVVVVVNNASQDRKVLVTSAPIT